MEQHGGVLGCPGHSDIIFYTLIMLTLFLKGWFSLVSVLMLYFVLIRYGPR